MSRIAAAAASGCRNRVWRWLAWSAALVGGVGLVLAFAFVNLGRWLEAPAESPSKADVIVLLGGDNIARLFAGLELYRQGMAPRIFLAGAETDALPASHPLPNVRLDYLLAEGVPREAITIDEDSRNSWQEAANTLNLMRQQGWRKAIVVSDPPHMRRLSWIWRRIFRGADASYVLVASRPRWWHGDDWWRDEWSGQFVLTEVIKIGYYFAVR